MHALECKVRTTAMLWARGDEKTSQGTCLCVLVPANHRVNGLVGFHAIRASRNASWPSDSISSMNWILGFMELKWQ